MRIPALFFVLVILCSCRNKTVQPEIAVYHWSSYANTYSLGYFRAINPFKTFYVRLFDIKWHPDYGAYPEAHVNTNLSPDSSLAIVPVIYITNEALILTPDDSLEVLFRRLDKEINYVWDTDFINHHPYKELQFDCDWTDRSREKFFKLLTYFRNNRKETISCTVKMYQYAYREKAGIPPADKAVLMCYNLGNPRDFKQENSIFSADEAKKYLKKADYPLPLDFALPNFSWGVLFRGGNYLGLWNDFHVGNFPSDLFRTTDSIHYVVQRDYMSEWDDISLKKGDVVRYESADSKKWLHIAGELRRHFNHESTRIILFDFDHLYNSELSKDSLYFSSLRAAFDS